MKDPLLGEVDKSFSAEDNLGVSALLLKSSIPPRPLLDERRPDRVSGEKRPEDCAIDRPLRLNAL